MHIHQGDIIELKLTVKEFNKYLDCGMCGVIYRQYVWTLQVIASQWQQPEMSHEPIFSE